MTDVALRPTLAVAALCSLLAACSMKVFQPSRTAQFEVDPAGEINDEDVRKAFEARPQMRAVSRIAYYSFDPSKAERLESVLRAMPGVAGTYRIPPLLATGQRRYEERRPWDAAGPAVGMKKLRLLAARAQCDLLVVLDYGYERQTNANGLVALNVLLLPAFFVPYLDARVESYLDSFVIDTRNGYLYAHTSAQKQGGEDYVGPFSDAAERMVEKQWGELLRDTAAAVRTVMQSERAARAAPASGAGSGEPAIAAPPQGSGSATSAATPGPGASAAGVTFAGP
jgi:hypothetical protein